MNDARQSWRAVQRIADEIEPRICFAEPNVRDRWDALQPRLSEIERLLPCSGEHARNVLLRKLATVGAMLRRLHDDVAYAHG
jgi:hypothetical protein